MVERLEELYRLRSIYFFLFTPHTNAPSTLCLRPMFHFYEVNQRWFSKISTFYTSLAWQRNWYAWEFSGGVCMALHGVGPAPAQWSAFRNLRTHFSNEKTLMAAQCSRTVRPNHNWKWPDFAIYHEKAQWNNCARTINRCPSHSSFSISVWCKRPLGFFSLLSFFTVNGWTLPAPRALHVPCNSPANSFTPICAVCILVYVVPSHNNCNSLNCCCTRVLEQSPRALEANWDIVRLNVLPHRIRHANRVHFSCFSSFAGAQCTALNDMVY